MILILRFYVHKVTVSLGPNFPSRAGRERGTQRAGFEPGPGPPPCPQASDRPPPDPFPAFEWKPVPWAGTEPRHCPRSCLRGGGDRASRPDSRPEGRPGAGDVSAPSGQNTRRARVPSTSYRGKGRRPHDTTEWLLPPSVEWLQLYSLNTSEDRRTNAETGAKAD